MKLSIYEVQSVLAGYVLDTQGTQAVALYWGFENLHASLSEAKNGDGSYGKQDGRFKVQTLCPRAGHHRVGRLLRGP